EDFSWSSPDHPSSFQDQIYSFYRPLVHNITDPTFVNDDNQVFTVQGEPRIKSPLGKKAIILTVDSRPRNGVGELLAGDPLKFATASPSAFGALNHYLYALIHVYDYRYVRAPEFADRYGTWVKVPIVEEALLTHDVAVFMDGDVGVHYPHVPLEWLMNHWNITDETLVAAPVDVHQYDNFNDRGEVSLNTGFLLGQASQRIHELFQEWVDCPLELTDFYAGCSTWAYNWAHEQAALRDYIRHKYDRPEDVVEIPCAEANGSPDHPDGSQQGGEGGWPRWLMWPTGVIKYIIDYRPPREVGRTSARPCGPVTRI
ncbi:uncharacterized protein TRUGW13939_10598, partial [Talaromyces rugulosus]